MHIVSVDPGASGGLAVLSNGGVESRKMPETTADVFAFLERAQIAAIMADEPIRCFMEKVSGFIGEAQPGSSSFVFGQGYGEIIGMLTAMRIPFELVTPQKWQKPLALGKVERTKSPPGATEEEQKAVKNLNAKAKGAWKNKLKAKAQQLFPDQKVTLATSDCLLILEYARQQENQKVKVSGALPI